MKPGATSFEVYIRIRPCISQEISAKPILSLKSQSSQCSELLLHDPSGSSKVFTFNKIFPEHLSTSDIYPLTLQPHLPNLQNGFNTTIFAYGSTGSGKTHTMFGSNSCANSGLAFLSIRDIFSKNSVESLKKVSFLEIYNETIIDLLSQKQRPLMIVEDPIRGVIVQDIQEVLVRDVEEVCALVAKGNKNRARAATAFNEHSTRSHGVLQVCVESQNLIAKLAVIDLAGSERAAASENRGIRLKEGANINRSLLALGNCINILSDPIKKGAYVPFRDSKLTRLLKESLGGNSKTIMIACVSALRSSYEDTLQTLKYASRAKNITTYTTQSTRPSDYLELINSLRSEIEVLKLQLSKPASSSVAVKDNINSDLLSQQIINNFEEHWEIKKSIQEIEALNTNNRLLLHQSANNENLLRTIKDNEEKKSGLLEILYFNMKQRQTIQSQVSEVKDQNKRELLGLQIDVRKLMLEKIDLYVQAEEAKKESLRKDEIICEMRVEIEKMRNKIGCEVNIQENSPRNTKRAGIARENLCPRPLKSLQKEREKIKMTKIITHIGSNTELYTQCTSITSKNKDSEKISMSIKDYSKQRTFSMGNLAAQLKPGLFSELQCSSKATSRPGSVSKVRNLKSNETSLEKIKKPKKILQKKDVNILHKMLNRLKK